jgi:hypothetical protein
MSLLRSPRCQQLVQFLALQRSASNMKRSKLGHLSGGSEVKGEARMSGGEVKRFCDKL